jgi:hypothetical protein
VVDPFACGVTSRSRKRGSPAGASESPSRAEQREAVLATIVVRSANWVYDTVVIDLLRFVLGLVTDSWMAGCLVAKAKVAGSNPVFRSKVYRGPAGQPAGLSFFCGARCGSRA